MLAAMLFDVDGVLVDSPHERAWCGSLAALMAGPWAQIAPQTRYTPAGFSTAVYQAYVAGKPREAGARAALDYFGVPDADGMRLQQYCDTKQAHLLDLVAHGDFTAFDDALRLVLRARAAGYLIGAASSSKNANMFLRKVRLDPAQLELPGLGAPVMLIDAFDANVCGVPFAYGKPHPEIFLNAAAALGIDPAACTVIEDAPSGIQAAKAGGMRAIGIARLNDADGLRAAGADLVVTTLDLVAL